MAMNMRLLMVGALFSVVLVGPAAMPTARAAGVEEHNFAPPFDEDKFSFNRTTSSIASDALQITPDSAHQSMVPLHNRSGRILLKKPFTLWKEDAGNNRTATVASFNTTMLINIAPFDSDTAGTKIGDGMAFIIAPDLSTPPGSYSQYLGLTNSSNDGNAINRLFAIEFDTNGQDGGFDPDGNHIGIDINSIRSNITVSLSKFNIKLGQKGNVFHNIWIQYDGRHKTLAVYIAQLLSQNPTVQRPESPVLTMDGLDLSSIVEKELYMGFSASTGAETEELNCVLRWNITIEVISGGGGGWWWWWIPAGAAVAAAVVVAAAAGVWMWRRRRAKESNIVGALKCLPGMPREFEFGVLKKATGNFEEKNRLGEGGYGIVFRGVLAADENAEVAVKKFTREDSLKSKDDFLSELTIINRLRHRHLVKLLGWCHKNRMLLLVYEYMPNGILEKHIFRGEGETPISWELRYKILQGVASAVRYLHHEYDETVIHRDIKANNIMLDAHFNARLGDFGLARALDQEKTSYAESSAQGAHVHGTIGYIAPECFHTGKATRESDVYALGIVLLEVACGHRPWAKLGGFNCLGDWVWSLHREGRVLEALDSRVGNQYVDVEEAGRVLLLGLACLHPIASERPNAHDVEQILSGSMPLPKVPHFKPTFMWPAMDFHTSIDVSTTASITSSPFDTDCTHRSSSTPTQELASINASICMY